MKRKSMTTSHAVASSQTTATARPVFLTDAALSQVTAGGGPALPDNDPTPTNGGGGDSGPTSSPVSR